MTMGRRKDHVMGASCGGSRVIQTETGRAMGGDTTVTPDSSDTLTILVFI